LKDAKLDVTALSERIERMIGEAPPGLLSNAELNVMEEDEQPTELTESNERSDIDGREERRGEEELQQAEAQRLAEEERCREEEPMFGSRRRVMLSFERVLRHQFRREL
jgi:hypothetical protein